MQAGQAKQIGDFATAQQKTKTSTILAVVSAVLGLVVGILYVILNVVMVAANSH